MSKKPSKSRALLLGIIISMVFITLSFLIDQMAAPPTKSRIELWLGINLPSDTGDIRYWYQQPRGYYQANLACRIQLSRESFLKIMKDAGIERVNGPEWPLPTKFISDSSITWWNPPSIQTDRFHQQQQGGWITLVWSDGFIYAERDGNFGSMWGPHKTVHN